MESLKLIHPYLLLFAGTVGEALFLALLAGLWFFRRWARSVFVVLLALALVYSVFRPPHAASIPPQIVLSVMWIMVMLHGAIVAMSFLPPVRDKFTQRYNQALEPTASHSDG